MKKFIQYLLATIVSVLIIMTVLDLVYTYGYIHAKPRNKVQYILKLKNKKIDYGFLGSSRVDNHIVTKMVEKATGGTAINLGVQGGKLDVTYLILQLLLDNNVQFKKLFIEIDYNYNIEGNSNFFKAETLPYIRNNSIINTFQKKNNPDYFLCYYLPFYRYASNDYKIGFREFFNSTTSKHSTENFADGFNPRKEPFHDKGYTLPKTINKSNKMLDNIDRLCKEKHIDVTYFCAPFCSQVATSDYPEKLQQKIPNFKNYSKTLLDQKYYVNCGHLNEDGAKLFTKILIDDCILKPSK